MPQPEPAGVLSEAVSSLDRASLKRTHFRRDQKAEASNSKKSARVRKQLCSFFTPGATGRTWDPVELFFGNREGFKSMPGHSSWRKRPADDEEKACQSNKDDGLETEPHEESLPIYFATSKGAFSQSVR
jgi:hypothetical protein